jgi:Ca2+-binding EF-hand superfamily protein
VFKYEWYKWFWLEIKFLNFRAFDRDQNGFIDFSEFVIAFSITSFGDIKEKAQFAFKIFDLGNYL